MNWGSTILFVKWLDGLGQVLWVVEGAVSEHGEENIAASSRDLSCIKSLVHRFRASLSERFYDFLCLCWNLGCVFDVLGTDLECDGA